MRSPILFKDIIKLLNIIKIKKIDILILILIGLTSLILRIPSKNSILSNFDQLFNFNGGARFLKSSPFQIKEWYNNTFAQLFILTNQGISDVTFQALNLLILKFFNLRIGWWSYSLFYYLLDTLNVLLIYVLLNFFVNKKLSIIGAFLYLTMPVYIIYSSIRPDWLIYSVFFEILFIFSIYIFNSTNKRLYLHILSIILCFILLGDPNFAIMLLLSTVLILLWAKKHTISRVEIFKFYLFPSIVILLNILSAAISIYKGYFLGLFGYALGHFREIGGFNKSLNFISYVKAFVNLHGFFILFNLFILSMWLIDKFFITKRNNLNFFENLIGIWNILLIILVFLLRRYDNAVGLWFLPAIIFTICFLKNKSKLFVYLCICLIICQFILSINLKLKPAFLENTLKFPYARFLNKDFGQKAVGFWIRKNTNENDSVLIITPDIPQSHKFLKYAYPNYAQSSELYFKKIYAYCKGKAPKKLFTVKNIFNGRLLYNISDPPKYVVDFSGLENNFSKLKEYVNFPVKKYGKKVIIINHNNKIIACLYQKGWDSQTSTLRKEDLDLMFDKEYAYFDEMVFSPYQGLWAYIP